LPDDSSRQILPNEWLNRLAERRENENRRPGLSDIGIEQGGAADGSTSSAETAIRVAAEQARKRLGQKMERVRAEMKELIDLEQADAQRFSAEAVGEIDEHLRLFIEQRLHIGLDQLREQARAAATESHAWLREMFDDLSRQAEARLAQGEALHASDVEELRRQAREQASAVERLADSVRADLIVAVESARGEAIEAGRLMAEQSAAEVRRALEASLTSQLEASLEAIRKEAEERAQSLAAQERAADESLSATALEHLRAIVGRPRSGPTALVAPQEGERTARAPEGTEPAPAPSLGEPFARHRAEIERSRVNAAVEARKAEENLVAAVELCHEAPGRISQGVDRLLDDLLEDVKTIGQGIDRPEADDGPTETA
jgi:hypothetical protein